MPLPPEQVRQLAAYCQLLWSWNERINLTRHTTVELFVTRDVADAWQLSRLIGPEEEMLDVGAGGGAIGIILSFAVAEVIDRLLMPASLSLPIVGLALGVSVVVGLIAGLIPAWRASRLNPIEALRYE